MHKAWLERRAALKAHYLKNQNISAHNERIFLPTYYEKVAKLRKESIPLSPWKETKSLKPDNHRFKFRKEPVSRNEVLPLENEDSSVAPTSLEKLLTTETPSKPVTSTEHTRTTTYYSVELTTQRSEVSLITESSSASSLTSTQTDSISLVADITSLPKEDNGITEATLTPPTFIANISDHNAIGKPKSSAKNRPNALWGRWMHWTECSRSCGGGVMSQSRQCFNR